MNPDLSTSVMVDSLQGNPPFNIQSIVPIKTNRHCKITQVLKSYLDVIENVSSVLGFNPYSNGKFGKFLTSTCLSGYLKWDMHE